MHFVSFASLARWSNLKFSIALFWEMVFSFNRQHDAGEQQIKSQITMKTKTTCRRCSGSGRHSFNALHGSKCYGCNGTGIQMIDLAAEARRSEASAKRNAAAEAGRREYIAAMRAAKARLNTYGFDITTELGLNNLAAAVERSTGMTLEQHAEAQLTA